MLLRAVLALVLAAIPCVACASAPSAATTMRSLDGATIIRANDAAAGLVGVQLVVRAGLDRQALVQNGLSALTAWTVLLTPVPTTTAAAPKPLEDAISALGGSVRFRVGANQLRFYIEATPSSVRNVLALFGRALAAPSFDRATIRMARTDLDYRIAGIQRIPLMVGYDMLHRADAPTANTALPKLGTQASLAQFVPADVRSFYGTYFRRGGAYVTAVGHLDALPQGTLATLVDALKPGATSAIAVRVARLSGTSRQLRTSRDIAAPWLIARYAAPTIGSRDFGPMLVLEAFLQRTLADASNVPGAILPTFASNAVGTRYTYSRATASLMLYVNGGMGNSNRAFTTALSLARVLGSAKLNGSIDQFKAVAEGNFATGTTMLQSRAFLATVAAQRFATPDFQARVTSAIAATTASDIQRVARKYLNHPTIALVLPRQKN